MKVSLLSGFVGAVFGAMLTFAAVCQAGGGHGSYTLWAVASLPSLAIGMGQPYALLCMFGVPVVQWLVVGLCVGKVWSGKGGRWAFGVFGVGVAYFVTWLVGGDSVRSGFDSDTASRTLAAGLVMSGVLIVASIMMFLVARRRDRVR
jgi:hypothetical protein